MSEFSSWKCLWDRSESNRAIMEGCYKLYAWINYTVLMLLFQIFWKMSQISDYFRDKSVEEKKAKLTCAPLTMQSKMRRHIRSMSDVQSSTPYRIPFRARQGSAHTLMYDSDTRARRIRAYNRTRQQDSSDSSDYESPMKLRSLERNILKHTDSMRIL